MYSAPNRSYRHPSSTRVRFLPITVSSRSRPLASLSVCNTLIDRYPRIKHHHQENQEAIVDSGASNHFTPISYDGGNHQDDSKGVLVKVADDRIIRSTATDSFNLPVLPTAARTCYKFPRMSSSLFSVGQVCDADMKVMFDKHYVHIFNPSGEIVLEGYRHPTSKLYMLPLASAGAALPRVPHQSVPRVQHSFSAYKVR